LYLSINLGRLWRALKPQVEVGAYLEFDDGGFGYTAMLLEGASSVGVHTVPAVFIYSTPVVQRIAVIVVPNVEFDKKLFSCVIALPPE
jgi:hypothetical protein